MTGKVKEYFQGDQSDDLNTEFDEVNPMEEVSTELEIIEQFTLSKHMRIVAIAVATSHLEPETRQFMLADLERFDSMNDQLIKMREVAEQNKEAAKSQLDLPLFP